MLKADHIVNVITNHYFRKDMEELKEDPFISLVEDCRLHNKFQDIYNASFEHARILVGNLFETAKKNNESVKIVSGSLNESFYNPLTEKIKGLEVDIVILNHKVNLSNNDFAKAASKITQASQEDVVSPHFILVGNNKYRLETDQAQAKAIGNFNDPHIGGLLLEHFNKLKINLLLHSDHNGNNLK